MSPSKRAMFTRHNLNPVQQMSAPFFVLFNIQAFAGLSLQLRYFPPPHLSHPIPIQPKEWTKYIFMQLHGSVARMDLIGSQTCNKIGRRSQIMNPWNQYNWQIQKWFSFSFHHCLSLFAFLSGYFLLLSSTRHAHLRWCLLALLWPPFC